MERSLQCAACVSWGSLRQSSLCCIIRVFYFRESHLHLILLGFYFRVLFKNIILTEHSFLYGYF